MANSTAIVIFENLRERGEKYIGNPLSKDYSYLHNIHSKLEYYYSRAASPRKTIM